MSKKMDAIWTIVQHSTGAAALIFPPTPSLEGHKHMVLAGNELAMCYRIANIYSKEYISKEGVVRLLQEAGIATAGAGAGAYIATKVGHTVAQEALNFAGPLGWTLKSLLGTSLTASVGTAFMAFCEARFGR